MAADRSIRDKQLMEEAIAFSVNPSTMVAFHSPPSQLTRMV